MQIQINNWTTKIQLLEYINSYKVLIMLGLITAVGTVNMGVQLEKFDEMGSSLFKSLHFCRRISIKKMFGFSSIWLSIQSGDQ